MAQREISVAEAARTLAVTLHHVYALLWGGQLDGRRINGQWRVSADAVESRRKQREAGAK
jgi:excisionase family DNA binding protein